MRNLLLVVAILTLAACDITQPIAPSPGAITITNITNVGGDDDHSGDKSTGDIGDDNGGTQNQPPSLIVPSTITSNVGDSVTATILASDPDGDVVVIGYDPQSAPRDCSISPNGVNSARISCVISSSSASDSPFTVRVTGDDGQGASTTAFFVWIVNAPPAP